MLQTKFQIHRPFVPEKKIFYGFYHIWTWRPSWSSDHDHLNKFSFPQSMETPYEIWLQLAHWLQRRCFKMSTYDRRRRHAYTISSPVSLKAQVSWKYGSSYFSYLFHKLNFKILSLTVVDRMQSMTHTCTDAGMDRPKPICLLNFFEVGGINNRCILFY